MMRDDGERGDTPAMALCLKPLNPANFPQGVIEIPEGDRSVYLGRDAGNDFQVDEQSVSSRHACLSINANGVLELNDCDSSNGTFVNGRKISQSELVEGDRVKLAFAEFTVQDVDAPVASHTIPAAPATPLPPQGPSEAELAAGAEILALKGELKSLNDELHSTKRDLAESVDREARSRQQLSSTREELMGKERDIAALTYEVTQRDGNLARLQESSDQQRTELDQLKVDHNETTAMLEQKSSALIVALQRADSAESSRSALFSRTGAFLERLQSDWKDWMGNRDFDGSETDDEVDAVFGKSEKVADAIRAELDQIEPIWHEFGNGVQKELERRCSNLESERANLEKRRDEKLKLHQEASTDLEEIRSKVDNEVRRAQSLSRKGTEVAIPERFESMVIANDREQEIFRLLIDRVDELDGLVESYAKSKKYRDIYLELTAFQDHLATVLSESGVTPFVVDTGTMLTPKLRKEVQILVKKGWGTKEFMEQPFRPGEVKKIVRHGYRIAAGEHFEILRKVEVLIREVGD